MDINTLIAARSYADSRPATEPSDQPGGAQGAFAQAAQNFADTLNHADQVAQAAMSGNADPHALVQALADSQLAVETAVTVRDKVVEAYQEILRMPV